MGALIPHVCTLGKQTSSGSCDWLKVDSVDGALKTTRKATTDELLREFLSVQHPMALSRWLPQALNNLHIEMYEATISVHFL